MGRACGQHGGAIAAFHGTRVQRGYGLGGLLRGLFRTAVPLLKQGAKAVGKTALKTGAQIASDVLQGGDIKSSVRNRTSQARQNLRKKAKQKALRMIGGGRKSKGKIIKKKRKIAKNRRKTYNAATNRMKGAVLKKKKFP